MSRKHAHRADNQPVTRRYVRSVVQRAKKDIIAAIVHGQPGTTYTAPVSGLYWIDGEDVTRTSS